MSLVFERPDARRTFLGRLAAGAAALAATPLMARAARVGEADIPLVGLLASPDGWLGAMKGAKHKQVFDAPHANGGFPMIFAGAYLGTMTDTYKLGPKEAHAVLVLRHFAAPMALSDAMWDKYKIGAMVKVNDPATGAPATRNIFVNSREGDIMRPEWSVEKMIAKGVTVCVCNVALTVLSGMFGGAINVKPDDALAEWKANLVAGSHVVPSGVLAIGRAQEAGCSYCFAG